MNMATDVASRVAARERAPFFVRMVRGLRSFTVRKPLGAAGAFIIVIMALLAALEPLITFFDPVAMNLRAKLEAPSLVHWLGTDELGRDLWTRIVLGAQVSLIVGFGAVGFGSTTGGLLGVLSAFYGGKVDAIIQRLMDALMAIPTLILALAIMAALGQSLFNVILAIGIVQIPRANRIVRSQALAVKESEYALAAQSIGAGDVRIMLQHILPQCVAPWLIIASAGLGTAIIAEASLSFLGLGIPPPQPAWGGMLSGPARDYYALAPWLAIWPGIAISLTVYGFNLFGDALRDVLDPRLRGT
ncbi:ABC transporter permease [SAR202 cluster bacterium AC-647-N09_OGT_505m]|nr:ABC transporter permease [SAR202 cluster bacterium AC-647-N09_OGT_505m]